MCPRTLHHVLINVILPRVQELKRCWGGEVEGEGEYMQDYKKRVAKINGHWDDCALEHFFKVFVCGLWRIP